MRGGTPLQAKPAPPGPPDFEDRARGRRGAPAAPRRDAPARATTLPAGLGSPAALAPAAAHVRAAPGLPPCAAAERAPAPAPRECQCLQEQQRARSGIRLPLPADGRTTPTGARASHALPNL